MSLSPGSGEDSLSCAELDLNEACTSASDPSGACSDDSFIPWNRIFLCSGHNLGVLAYVGFVFGLLLLTVLVMWIGVNLLSKNAEMYFAPALEDLCIKWDVPKRTAAALFIALANGAPDLAATGYMFKQGQGDMAFGALLGAGVYVCMNVIGMIILLPPKVAMQATPALIRDVVSFLLILGFLLPIFLWGLTWKWVLVLNCTYAVMTLAIFVGDEWHKRGRPALFTSLFRVSRSGGFEPLVASEANSDSSSDAPSDLELQEPWDQPSSPRQLPATFSTCKTQCLRGLYEAPCTCSLAAAWIPKKDICEKCNSTASCRVGVKGSIQEASARMHQMRASRLQNNRLALNNGECTVPENRPMPLENFEGSPGHSNQPSRTNSPPLAGVRMLQVPPTFLTDQVTASHFESAAGSGVGGAIVESSGGHRANRTDSSSTGGASGRRPDSPSHHVLSPLGEDALQSAKSAGASTSTSRMIFPGDSISQQRGPAPDRGYPGGMNMDTFEVEVALPHAPTASWALNDSLRVLGMLFPPCGEVPSASTPCPPNNAGAHLLDPFHDTSSHSHPGSPPFPHASDAAASGGSPSYPTSFSPAANGPQQHRRGPHMHALHAYPENSPEPCDEDACACAGSCMPVMQWFSHALDVPDYVAYFSQPARLRHPAHGLGLLIMLLPMALMRVTIPTVSGDFYDAFILVVAATLSPAAAVLLFGMHVPWWLQVVLSAALCMGAMSVVASGGFGLPQWIQGDGLLPRLCMLAMSAATLFMAVGWIQIIAGELVGCLQAFGNLIHCPPSLLGFTLAAVNSLGDQATNLAVARSAGKRAAIAACFSSMAFNLCLAPAYGCLLYAQKHAAAAVPLQVSGPTWLLFYSLAIYLLGLLGVIFWGWTRTGGGYIPYETGRAAQLAFAALMTLFVVHATLKWILKDPDFL